MATWILVALVGWVVVSVLVSLAVGGMIRLADSRRPSADVRPLRPAATPELATLRRVS